ncbi:MAG TPA: hypothetical protein PKE16_07400 [Hyphomicrobium sp.]|nr:hypothetical protein [Hyphomicrobium sp.]
MTVISAMYLCGITLRAYNSYNTANERAASQRRSFRQFLRGLVEIETGLVSGHEAMLQIALLPVSVAIGATGMALIWITLQYSTPTEARADAVTFQHAVSAMRPSRREMSIRYLCLLPNPLNRRT